MEEKQIETSIATEPQTKFIATESEVDRFETLGSKDNEDDETFEDGPKEEEEEQGGTTKKNQ